MNDGRCEGKNFWGQRCGNVVSDDDTQYCHIHSILWPREICGHLDPRNGRHCNRKPVERGELCAGHMPGPYAHLRVGGRLLHGHETGRFRS